jgi:hypothetical protein
MVVALTGIGYYFVSKINAERESVIKQRATDFYTDFTHEMNTNENWVGFIDKYAIENAKESLSQDAILLIESSNRGGQHLGRLMSPISVRIYKMNSKSVDTLVDFSFGERRVGDPEQITDVKKFITFKRVGSEWMVSLISDRTERFNEAIKI